MFRKTEGYKGLFGTYLTWAVFIVFAFACNSEPDSLIENPVPLKLIGGFGFTEGPVADSAGNIYFTDIPNNKVYRWIKEDGLEVIKDSTGWGNGMSFNCEGDLILCEMINRRVTKIGRNGEYEVLTDAYKGKKYNGPNDVWVHPDGGIYFSDPAYFVEGSEMEQDAEAVYYIHPQNGEVSRVSSHIARPNGLVGTSDGRRLYVVSDTVHKTWIYTIKPDGSLGEKELFVANGHDGLTLDERGNLYIANRDSLSVDIYDPRGKYLEQIRIPEQPSNVCFGGYDGKTLFVTAQTSIYAIEMNVRGPD